MNTFMPIHLKFNPYSFLKLSLITLTLLLLVGGYTRANAESAPKVEVISVPPQEAFYIEKKKPATSNSNNSSSVDEKISGTSAASTTLPPRLSDTWKKEQNFRNTAKLNTRS
jgi:hypothetical protein